MVTSLFGRSYRFSPLLILLVIYENGLDHHGRSSMLKIEKKKVIKILAHFRNYRNPHTFSTGFFAVEQVRCLLGKWQSQ